ncbi:MAG: hypothetical protein HWQ38_08000 [Nostoc sp. NMS7]|uniref:hypothetical protein n=1 Tax=Nostoc sp. NMS7 TaxID=2815391 RepID=UPI0025DDC6DC|nr:hypothetical protein [Nostoc sp. NMS7]MBN3946424.1 hypothetical protein [Nostoc sp. NMS7]
MAGLNIIKTELAKTDYTDLVKAKDYQGIADNLNNRPLIPNPVPQATVDKIPTILELFGAIAPAEAIEIYKLPGLVADIRTAAETKNKAALQAYLAIVSSLLSQQSKDAITALLAQTQLDPSYQPQITSLSTAEKLGIYPVIPAQIQSAIYL